MFLQIIPENKMKYISFSSTEKNATYSSDQKGKRYKLNIKKVYEMQKNPLKFDGQWIL